ncbi:hypothetical protein KW450_21380 [Vibrio fluvialis]|nr:hypothetical protein [Vibrio fluvialis]MBY7937676.1 hypothetical protein [Vibrio fluvialis]MBY7963688.1 hypothetical protein [Vibrio fluvialis]MBY7967935.1 hypothetical protein [Vibrio fluvialis]MBY8079484.1 hypothetical protein [Vibrio fluvialis]
MNLPPPSKDGSVYWRDYKIDTPAFRLNPIEKPDMSPHLVHMTGKESVLGILKSGRDNGGLIKACVPEDAKSWYKESVVCFTESPIFAIDAFRYIRFHRWQMDMRFGIGFSKEKLIKKGVFPVLYCSSELVSQFKKMRDEMPTSIENPFELTAKSVIDNVFPLMNSLMENEPKQGFIWEREWRSPNPEGFDFSYSDIDIICCPEEEQDEIVSILGDFANNIKFVRSWSQYNEVKEFLSSREKGWETHVDTNIPDDSELRRLKQKFSQERNKAIAYKQYAEKILSEIEAIDTYAQALELRVFEIEEALAQREYEEQNDFCCACGCVLDENTSRVLWNDDGSNVEYLCGQCHSDFWELVNRDD